MRAKAGRIAESGPGARSAVGIEDGAGIAGAASVGPWPAVRFENGAGLCPEEEQEIEELRESKHSDLLRAAHLRPPRPERRASQEEVCGAFPGTELRPGDGHGGSPGEAERCQRGSTASTARLNGGAAEGATGPPGGRGGFRPWPLCAMLTHVRRPQRRNAGVLSSPEGIQARLLISCLLENGTAPLRTRTTIWFHAGQADAPHIRA